MINYVTIFTLCLYSTTLCLPEIVSTFTEINDDYSHQESNPLKNKTYQMETLQLPQIPGIFGWTTEQFINNYKSSVEDAMKQYLSKSIDTVRTTIKKAESNDTHVLHLGYSNLPTDEALHHARNLLTRCENMLSNIPTSEDVKKLMNLIDKVDLKSNETYEKNPILKTMPNKLIATIDIFVKVVQSGAIDFTIAMPSTAITEKFQDEEMEKKIQETRKYWKWALENKKDEETQRILKALDKMQITIDDFVNVMPKIKYHMSDDVFKTQPGDEEIDKDYIIKRIKSSDFVIKDKLILKGILALLRKDEEDLHQSDEEWIKTLT